MLCTFLQFFLFPHPPCTHSCYPIPYQKRDKKLFHLFLKTSFRASLVAQWLGIRLPMQGTRVRAPVREEPTCRGAARPVSHNY